MSPALAVATARRGLPGLREDIGEFFRLGDHLPSAMEGSRPQASGCLAWVLDVGVVVAPWLVVIASVPALGPGPEWPLNLVGLSRILTYPLVIAYAPFRILPALARVSREVDLREHLALTRTRGIEYLLWRLRRPMMAAVAPFWVTLPFEVPLVFLGVLATVGTGLNAFERVGILVLYGCWLATIALFSLVLWSLALQAAQEGMAQGRMAAAALKWGAIWGMLSVGLPLVMLAILPNAGSLAASMALLILYGLLAGAGAVFLVAKVRESWRDAGRRAFDFDEPTSTVHAGKNIP